MTHELLTALIAFAFVTSITPGPNNLMLLASGANFGLRRTIPHMLGVSLGFVLLAVVVGAGLVRLFNAYPLSFTLLKAASVAYMLFLAWKIATAAPIRDAGAPGEPITFLQAALFQWVNPKAWAMALTAITAYAPTQSLPAVLLVSLILGAINLPSVGVWAMLGEQAARLLTSRKRLQAFNATMAILLILSLYPVLFP